MLKNRLKKLAQIQYKSGSLDLYRDTITTIAQILVGNNTDYEYEYDESKDLFRVTKDNKSDGQNYVGSEYGPEGESAYAYQRIVGYGKGPGVEKAKAKQDERKRRGEFTAVTFEDVRRQMQQAQQRQQLAGQPSQGRESATQSSTPPIAGAASAGKTSQAGKDFIKREESGSTSPVLKAYSDYGRFSIGFGNSYYPPRFASKKGYPENRPTKTSGGRTCDGRACVQAQDTINESEAEEIITEVLLDFEQGVSNTIKQQLTQNQFDALVSFAYNMGTRAFGNSNLAKMINQNPNDPRIRAEFDNYTKADKIPASAARNLLRRRKKEAAMYFEGKY